MCTYARSWLPKRLGRVDSAIVATRISRGEACSTLNGYLGDSSPTVPGRKYAFSAGGFFPPDRAATNDRIALWSGPNKVRG